MQMLSFAVAVSRLISIINVVVYALFYQQDVTKNVVVSSLIERRHWRGRIGCNAASSHAVRRRRARPWSSALQSVTNGATGTGIIDWLTADAQLRAVPGRRDGKLCCRRRR